MIYTTTSQHNVSNAVVFNANTHYLPFDLHAHTRHAPVAFEFNQPNENHKHDFLVIGNKKQAKFGAWYCEGLTNALAIYKADGDGKTTLSNYEQLPVLLCNDGDLKSVVTANVAEGYDHIRIVAQFNNQNDCYSAMQAAYAIDAKHYYLFNPETLEFSKISVPTSNIAYLVALIELAPNKDLNKLMLRLIFALATEIPSKNTIEDATAFVIATLATRGINVKHTALKLIRRSVEKRQRFIRQFNRIADYEGCNHHNCDELNNEQISELMENELTKAQAMFVDTRGMGAGKTNLMALRIQNVSACAYITHRVALISDACKRLNLISYKKGDRFADKIAVCINSLLQFVMAVEGKPLFIDEARQVYDTLMLCSTIDNRKELIECFEQILRLAPLVHIADAGMSDDALAFYKKHCGNKLVHVIETTTKQSEVNHWQLDSLDACRHALLKDLNHGKKGMVGCSSEAEAIKTRKFLIENGYKAKRILLVTGGNKGDKDVAQFLAFINNEGRKYDVIIHTSVLGSGVSVEIPDFEFTYLLCSNVLPSNQSMQMLARNRCAKDVYVAFGNPLGNHRVTNVNLLKQGQIEKLKNYAENEGFRWAVDIEPIVLFQDIDEMIHQSQAKRNQDLNDFANHFLILAELEGRHFVKIETKSEKIKGLSEEIKQEMALEIQAAPVIDAHEYDDLKKIHATTSEQTASIKLYEVTQMTGLPNHETVPPTIEDIRNYLKGYAAVLANFELLTANTQKLKTIDSLNYQHRNKTKSLTSRQKIFKDFLKPLLKAQKNGGITKPDLLKALAVLEKYAPELAAEFGNYANINPVRVGSIVGNFAKKFGYELVRVGRESQGNRNRIYEIKPMADIERYASNRNGLAN